MAYYVISLLLGAVNIIKLHLVPEAVNAYVRMYFLPSFRVIFTSYHTLIYKNDETRQN